MCHQLTWLNIAAILRSDAWLLAARAPCSRRHSAAASHRCRTRTELPVLFARVRTAWTAARPPTLPSDCSARPGRWEPPSRLFAPARRQPEFPISLPFTGPRAARHRSCALFPPVCCLGFWCLCANAWSPRTDALPRRTVLIRPDQALVISFLPRPTEVGQRCSSLKVEALVAALPSAAPDRSRAAVQFSEGRGAGRSPPFCRTRPKSGGGANSLKVEALVAALPSAAPDRSRATVQIL